MSKDPSVTIAMAIYKPNIIWLKEQLVSLNNQNYKNLFLLVWNDCPTDDFDYESIFNDCITRFSFKIFKSTNNLGSNNAFCELTKIVTSDYIAYCDQDDIWMDNKVSTLIECLKKENKVMACSDMYVINANGKVIYNTISKTRPFFKWPEKAKQFEYLITHNFVTGCTVVVESKFAKTILPFPKSYIHDWWLAINAAEIDSLFFYNKPLIYYRIHDNNQTSTLSGVINKKTYFNKRIIEMEHKLIDLNNRLSKRNANTINSYTYYNKCRVNHFLNPNFWTFINLLKEIKIDPPTVLFELVLPLTPNTLFEFVIYILKLKKKIVSLLYS